MAAKAPWDKPKKASGKKMTPAQKAGAKAWAKSHGKPYPSLIANMAAMKKGKRNG